MPGILDILNQGGQFLAGRNAARAQQEQARIAEKRALEEALLERRKAEALIKESQSRIRENDSLVADRQRRATEITPLSEEQYEGVASSVYRPDRSVAENTSQAMANFGVQKVDPLMVQRAIQNRADALAKPTVPTRGTPEYEAMLRREQAITDGNANAGGGGGAGGAGGGNIRGLPVAAQTALTNAAATRSAVNRYYDVADEVMTLGRGSRTAGKLAIPDEKRDALVGQLELARNAVRVTMKELGGLGVLNGPDMGILDGMIGDPLSWEAIARNPSFIANREAAVQAFIDSKVKAYTDAYGLDGAAFGMDPARDEQFNQASMDLTIDFMIGQGMTDEQIEQMLNLQPGQAR
jgi:hypothetical protein